MIDGYIKKMLVISTILLLSAATVGSSYIAQEEKTIESSDTPENYLGEIQITRDDWNKDNIFSPQSNTLKKLVGIMLNTPEIKDSIDNIHKSDNSLDRSSISKIITDWVSGRSIEFIANTYYNNDVSKCTKALIGQLPAGHF